MGDFQQVILAVTQVFTVVNLSVIFGGLVLGMIVGCIPGLSVTLGIILLLPLTYSFSSPDTAIISLLAVYVGGMYGGSISAITLNTPGTNSAIATTFDGYPLAKKGKVKRRWTHRCLHPYSAVCSPQSCCWFALLSLLSWYPDLHRLNIFQWQSSVSL